MPTPLSSFIGRDRERARVQEMLLRKEIRLLTLTGAGGIGKTRLAVQVATDIADNFADGIYFIPFDAIHDADQVAVTIALALDIQPTVALGHKAIAAALHNAKALLIVDNFEHMVTAAPYLVRLLAACPHLKLLVTSRVLLRVDGEHAMALPPLASPEPHESLSFDDLKQAAAIQLFVERVQAVDASFALSESNAPVVAEICRRVDGLPLAIELVAPRARHLGLPALLKRLQRRLPLLTGGPRDQPGRLQTMRGAIGWSYDLLAPEDQQLFRRLSVLAGGGDLAAVEVIAGRDADEAIGGNHRRSVVDSLGTLIDASLLQAQESAGGTTRYRMLETIREFGLERLEDSSDAEQIRRIHAVYYLELAEQHEFAELLPEVGQARPLLAVEYANLRDAMGWLEESGDVGPLLRLSAVLGRYWSTLGLYQEGYDCLVRALSYDMRGVERAKALVALGIIEIYRGLYSQAETTLATGLAECREAGDHFYAASALVGLGGLETLRGNSERAAELLEASLAEAQNVDNARLSAIISGWALMNLGTIARSEGDPDLATTYLANGLRCLREAGDTAGTITALCDLGDLARNAGDHARAIELHQEALLLSRGHTGLPAATYVIESVAVLAVTAGLPEAGARLLGASDGLRERLGLQLRMVENQLAHEQAHLAARSALGEEGFAGALSAGRGLSHAQALDETASTFAILARPSQADPPLTRRETEILHLVAAGHTDSEIAAKLFLSVRTIENHVAHILAKFSVRNRKAAVRAAGLTPPSPHQPA